MNVFKIAEVYKTALNFMWLWKKQSKPAANISGKSAYHLQAAPFFKKKDIVKLCLVGSIFGLGSNCSLEDCSLTHNITMAAISIKVNKHDFYSLSSNS